MKKINIKQPKYIFPLIIFLPLLFLGYEITNIFGGGKETATGVVTDSINMSLPDAGMTEIENKMAAMDKRMGDDDIFSAVSGLGNDADEKDSTRSGYTEAEMNAIDAENAKRIKEQKEMEALEKSLAASRRHINTYSGGGDYSYAGENNRNSRKDEMDDYAAELEKIQRSSRKRADMLAGISSDEDKDNATEKKIKEQNEKKKKEEKSEVVKKVTDSNADKFNTVGENKTVDEPLIKAMIDQTTKAHEGTRLRFKLLDDVTIKNIRIKKGTYLYGIVSGFGQQRVRANITSILVRDKFIKINLSVFDNDGLEGFYVPESTFRTMMKEAGSQAVSNNINFNSGYGSDLSGEAIALQALQNMYQSASSALSANMRKNKAKIKYNTIVYLVNVNNDNNN